MHDVRRGLLAGSLALALLAPATLRAQDDPPKTDDEKWDKIGDAAMDIIGAAVGQALREWLDAPPPAPIERAATPAEWEQAEALCAAADVGLRRVAGLDQPARRRSLAGRELKAKVVEVELESGLSVRRLTFDDGAAAAAYAGHFLEHQLGRPDPAAPSIVTALEGAGATRALLAAVEGACRGDSGLPDLTSVTGSKERRRFDVELTPKIPLDVPAGVGLRVDASDVRVERLRFDDAASAREFAGHHLRQQGTERRVADAWGRDLVMISGALADPAVAARLLRAAWRVAPASGERAGLVVLGERVRCFLALTAEGGLHAQAARRVASARRGPDPEREKFMDAPVHNDLRFRQKDLVYGQATLLRGGALVIEGRDKAEHERERRYLTDLARALGVELPPPASATVEAR